MRKRGRGGRQVEPFRLAFAEVWQAESGSLKFGWMIRPGLIKALTDPERKRLESSCMEMLSVLAAVCVRDIDAEFGTSFGSSEPMVDFNPSEFQA